MSGRNKRSPLSAFSAFSASAAEPTFKRHNRAQALQALRETQYCLRTLFNYAPDAIVLLDVATGRFVEANLSAEKLFGLPRSSLLELGPIDLSPPMQPGGSSVELGRQRIAEAINERESLFEWWHCNSHGERFPCDVHLVCMPWRDNVVVRGSIMEATGKKLLEISEIGGSQILQQTARGVSLTETLTHLVRAIESVLPGMLCSVLLFEHDKQCLRHAAAPSLPDFYNAAIDGVPIGPTVGSCGAAAFFRQRVVVSDIMNHPNWVAYRQLAERASVKACWSEPIFSLAGELLGTFAMYYRVPGNPAPIELKAIELAAQLAGTAVERVRAYRAMQDMNAALEVRVARETQQLVEATRELRAAEQKARLAAEAFKVHDSIVITGVSGEILSVNESFTRLTGYSPEEIIGQTPRVLRSGRHTEEFYRAMWEAIGTEGFWEGEVWNRRKNGELYLQRLTISAVRDASGEITHYVANGQDLTREKQAEADHAEIMAARKVQQTLLPPSSPGVPGLDIFGAVFPAESVSGDFFNFLRFGARSLGVMVADVSGHGLGPGLLMAQTQAYLHSLAESWCDPGEILSRANRFISANRSGHFVTMILCRLDLEQRSFVYASAGHQGYHLRADGTNCTLKATGTPLGVVEPASIPSSPPIALEVGDILMLPTDGIEEAINSRNQFFGRQRMFDVVRINAAKSAAQIVEALYSDVFRFDGGERRLDDVTVVVVKVLDPF